VGLFGIVLDLLFGIVWDYLFWSVSCFLFPECAPDVTHG